MSELRKSLEDMIPARLAMRLRLLKNRRELFGLHGPPSILVDLIPQGSVAVDCGAAQGLYSNFMAKRASVVYSFEANPEVYVKLCAGAAPRMKTFNRALSDREGDATLRVPKRALGEASLELHDRNAEIVEYRVRLATLDSFKLDAVGFLKIDVEGHELAVLRGAFETISDSRPVIFVEVEERHSPGSVNRVFNYLTGDCGYSSSWFLLDGEWYPFSKFDADRHQILGDGGASGRDYVSNFCFVS